MPTPVTQKTKHGTQVVFKDSGGSDFDLEQARFFLRPHQSYTLTDFEGGRIFLAEVEDECFNAKMFWENTKRK